VAASFYLRAFLRTISGYRERAACEVNSRNGHVLCRDTARIVKRDRQEPIISLSLDNEISSGVSSLAFTVTQPGPYESETAKFEFFYANKSTYGKSTRGAPIARALSQAERRGKGGKIRRMTSIHLTFIVTFYLICSLCSLSARTVRNASRNTISRT